ncbi:MAG TPA: type II toxin-antitoxin system VapC family toxin [Longimicrobium sp.]
MPGKLLLLDTSVIIDMMLGDANAERATTAAEQVFVPVPALGELLFGAEKSRQRELEIAKIAAFVSPLEVLPCEPETACQYGEIRNHLRLKGRPIPDNDIWIAAIAQQHDLMVVTRDAHFREIEDLALLTW